MTIVQHLLSIQATPDIAGIRTQELSGVEHTIVPCIALVEGVLWPQNAPAPELALAEEFGRFPASWNGRPIVMNHPKVDGVPVGANSPGILEEFSFGQIFNTTLDGDKLKTELWINNARVESLGGEIQETVDRLLSGEEVVEISTGLFTMSEQTEGEHNGQKFNAVWRNIVPDHLALLSKGTIGACSVEGGCGAPRVNHMKPAMKAVRLEDAKTPATQNAPVIDNTHVDCKCGGECSECKEQLAANAEANAEGQQGILRTIINSAQRLLAGNKGKDGVEDAKVPLSPIVNALSDRDIRTALDMALMEKVGAAWVIAVFQESTGSGSVVFENLFEGGMFQATFSIEEGGAVTIGEEMSEVRPETQFVPVTINAGNDDEVMTMDIKQRVAALISNEATQFTKDDEKWLLDMSEDQLKKLEPKASEEGEDGTEGKETSSTTPAAPTSAPAANAGKPGNPADAPKTLDAFLESAPSEIRAVLQEGLSLQKSRREHLIKGIMANERNEFTEDELKTMTDNQLVKIAGVAQAPSFEGAAIGQGNVRANAEDDNYAAAPDILNLSGKRDDGQQTATH